jgi:hypothetical protein
MWIVLFGKLIYQSVYNYKLSINLTYLCKIQTSEIKEQLKKVYKY